MFIFKIYYHNERGGSGNVIKNEEIYCCKVLYIYYNLLKNSGPQ